MSNGFNKPDVKGPRFKTTSLNILNRSFIASFKKKYPRYKDQDEKVIKDIIRKFNELVWQTVIENRDGVQLPESLGIIFIATCEKSKKKNINFGKSQKYGVTVVNNNWDTDGKLAKIFYTNYASKYKFKNREFWGFTACREFKRTVAKTYPENWSMYVPLFPTRKTKELYDKFKAKSHAIEREKKILKDYKDIDI